MLAHNLKDILKLIPESKELIKQANIEEEFPLDSPDSASASYLRAHFLIKVAGKSFDMDQFDRIEKAVSLYGTKDALDAWLPRFNTLEKKASEAEKKHQPSVKEAEANFEGNLAGFGYLGIEKTASAAEDIYSKFGPLVKSAEVLRYSGNTYINKEAAIQALSNRYTASKDIAFVKIARVIVDNVRDNDFKAIHEVCKTVTGLDKKAGLDIIGFNFYKEALFAKKADYTSSLNINLAGSSVPYEKVMNFGKERIGATIGKDVEGSMTDCPVNNKAVLESLPRDTQVLLKSLLKAS